MSQNGGTQSRHQNIIVLFTGTLRMVFVFVGNQTPITAKTLSLKDESASIARPTRQPKSGTCAGVGSRAVWG